MAFGIRSVTEIYGSREPKSIGGFPPVRRRNSSPDWIQDLVVSDRPFTQDVAAAYAESWALSFYLSEKMPVEYSQYLAATAGRKPFVRVTGIDRMTDFSQSFGDNWQMLDARVRRFMADLR